jgi:hypothetical protein
MASMIYVLNWQNVESIRETHIIRAIRDTQVWLYVTHYVDVIY